MSGQLSQFTATELVEAYAARRVSPVEVAEAVLARIESVNEECNAFCFLDPDSTLAEARASEARWQRGEPAGRLDGVPVSVKDLVLTKGWPTIRGSRTTDPHQEWDEDAPLLRACASMARSSLERPRPLNLAGRASPIVW